MHIAIRAQKPRTPATARKVSAAVVAVLISLGLAFFFTGRASARTSVQRPTIVLVHGAFAGSSSWSDVIRTLNRKGYPVVAVANPLRSIKGDAAYVASLVRSIPGPVVLVGHSYGGSVITSAADGLANVKGLVYVAGFAADVGESPAKLAGQFPGSTLGPAIAPAVTLPDGDKDLYISTDKYHAQFAADVGAASAAVMAATQRPITEAALNEASASAAWKSIPSWFIYGTLDRNIPAAAHAFMAERAHSRKTVAVKGASHVVMISHPGAVAALIEEAASY
ncbi:alpha/beta hydrolase [Dokdonella sp.]|uniref:alpha/beta fold hydrolase n=1 Tax=Dokdonella sp. TaxID=2291710 RepID=UPI002F3F840C